MRDRDEIDRLICQLSGFITAQMSREIKNPVAFFRRKARAWELEVIGQRVMFSDENDFALSVQKMTANLLGKKVTTQLGDFTAFLGRVEYALGHGWIEGDCLAPFYTRESRRALVEMLEAQQALLPILERIMDSRPFAELEALVDQSLESARRIQTAAGDLATAH